MNNLINGERRRWVALAVVCMGQLMMVLDATIVNVALPSMQRDLGFSQANLAWVLDAYLIAFGSFLLLAGRLGDLLGRKRMFLSGVAMFTLASVACGLAGDQVVLIAARFLQGLGGAVASAAVLALLVTDFPKPSERAIAMSVYTFILAGGGSLGLFAGGVLTQAVDWHWIFFINVPIGIVTFALGSVLINETERLGLGHGLDVAGAVLVTAALMLGVYAIVKVTDYGWLSAHTLASAPQRSRCWEYSSRSSRDSQTRCSRCGSCASAGWPDRASYAGSSARACTPRSCSACSTSSTCTATGRWRPASRSYR